MAQELVITSVRRGLDGGSGYQPVLRTRGMKPALAERLQIRSSYAHPFPHGDQRNPVVYVHRIERIAGQTLHVLGRLCDAGSDHTGRSNFLSHLVALEEPETRRKSAGPADVARRFAYRKTWSENPREIEPPALIGGDRAPGPCEAWRSSGLDPGLAGDLAEAAINGSEVRLVLRTKDDALALFADALTLVPPARRWAVTFNTCEIESFDATWRATREDLSQAKAWRGSPGVIDLTSLGVRGSDGVYARFARGESVALPWQTQESASAGVTSVAEKSPTVSQAPASAAARAPIAPRDVPAATPPPAPDSPPFLEPPFTSPPLTSDLPAKRNYLKRLETDRDHRQRREEDRPASVDALQYVLAIVAALLLGVGLAGFVLLQLNPELKMRIAAAWRDLTPDNSPESHSNKQETTSDDAADLGETAQTQREQLQKQEQERQKLKQKEESDRAEMLAQAKRDEEARLVREMEQKQEEEKASLEKKAKDLQQKRELAFTKLRELDGISRQDLPTPGQLDPKTFKAAEICTFDPTNLVGLALELAVPIEMLPEQSKFRAWIEPVADEDLTWRILSDPPTVTGDRDVKPIELGVLSINEGVLRLMPSRAEILRTARFSVLRRSVLLIKAVDPRNEGRQGVPVVAASIQLVRPASISDKTVSLFTNTKPSDLWEFMSPIVGSNTDSPIPENATINYGIFFASKSDEVMPQPNDASFFPLLQAKDASGNPVDAWIGVRTTISKNAMRVAPAVAGSNKLSVDIDRIRDTLSKTEAEIHEEKTNRIRSLQPRVKKLAKLRAQDFPSQLGQLESFLNQYGKDFGGFLGDKDGIQQWQSNCQSLVGRANSLLSQIGQTRDPSKPLGAGREWTQQDVAPQLAEVERQWQTTYSQPLQAWCDEFITKHMADLESIRNIYRPLTEPLAIRISNITCEVFDVNGEKYQVILASRNETSAKTKPAEEKDGAVRANVSIK